MTGRDHPPPRERRWRALEGFAQDQSDYAECVIERQNERLNEWDVVGTSNQSEDEAPGLRARAVGAGGVEQIRSSVARRKTERGRGRNVEEGGDR